MSQPLALAFEQLFKAPKQEYRVQRRENTVDTEGMERTRQSCSIWFKKNFNSPQLNVKNTINFQEEETCSYTDSQIR